MTVDERFWAKVDVAGPDECWVWTAATSKNGYGTFSLGPKSAGMCGAHRVAYMMANSRTLSPLEFVCHTCDNRVCVNPAHLWLGDVLANNRDCRSKGRWTSHHKGGRKNAARDENGKFTHA